MSTAGCMAACGGLLAKNFSDAPRDPGSWKKIGWDLGTGHGIT